MSIEDFQNLNILDAFSIFNLDSILTNTTSSEFSEYATVK